MKVISAKNMPANLHLMVIFLVGFFSQVIICYEEFEVPVANVTRRLGGDSYAHLNSNIWLVCHDDGNLTYLVSERRCVKNEELFQDCRFAIAPGIEGAGIRIGVTFSNQYNTMLSQDLITVSTFTFNNHVLVNATIVLPISNIYKPVNSSWCHIASLEVYRGDKQVTTISHDGFILSEDGTVMIRSNLLAYSINDFEGELYRMNLSCISTELPENGCVFFKELGATNLLKAKFNNTVHGTIFQSETQIKLVTGQLPENTDLEITTDYGTTINIVQNSRKTLSITFILLGPGFVIALIIFVVSILYVTFLFRRRRSTTTGIAILCPCLYGQKKTTNKFPEVFPNFEKTAVKTETSTVAKSNQTSATATQSVDNSEENIEQNHNCMCTTATSKKFDLNPIYVYLGPEEIVTTPIPLEMHARIL